MKLSDYLSIIICLISILSGFFVTYYFYKKTKSSKKIKQLKSLTELVKWLENKNNYEISGDFRVKEIISSIDLLLSNCNDNFFHDIQLSYKSYCKNQNICVFIKSLWNFQFSNSNISGGKEIIYRYNRLIEDYNNLVSTLNNIRIFDKDSQKSYVDNNDKKLRSDINLYEPYLNYWDDSDYWIYQEIKKTVEKKRNGNKLYFLDIGTGNGKLVEFLSNENDFVYLLDSDTERLLSAQSNISTNKTVRSLNIRFEHMINKSIDVFFDIIICSHVIQHNSTEVTSIFFNKIHSFLKSNGLCFIMFPLSKSNNEEFVVHGLEFDIYKTNKSKLQECIKNNDLSILNFNGENNLKTKNRILNNDYSNSGYIYITEESKLDTDYEIAERENTALTYKRVKEKGLICSLSTCLSNEFINDKNIIINEINKYIEYTLSVEKSKITTIILSKHWLICDILTNNNYLLFDNCGKIIAKRVLRVILKHRVYDDMLNSGHIPVEFAELISNQSKKNILYKLDDSTWNIDNEIGIHIASIFKTASRYSLLLVQQPLREVKFNTEDLLTKKIPKRIIRELFNANANGKNLFIDAETSDGWFIECDNNLNLFARLDEDWIRVFYIDLLLDKFNEGQQSIEFERKLNLSHENELDIVIKPILKDRIWQISSESQKKIILPNYKIVRLNNSKKGNFFIYRDKKYNRLSNKTFNELLNREVDILKILPSHRYVINTIKKDFSDIGFQTYTYKLYHSFNPKKFFLDKLILRDKVFNLFFLKNKKWIRRYFDIQDIMFVLKKKSKY